MYIQSLINRLFFCVSGWDLSWGCQKPKYNLQHVFISCCRMFTNSMTINHVLPKGKVFHFEKWISDRSWFMLHRVKIWLQQKYTRGNLNFLLKLKILCCGKKKKNVINLFTVNISHSNDVLQHTLRLSSQILRPILWKIRNRWGLEYACTDFEYSYWILQGPTILIEGLTCFFFVLFCFLKEVKHWNILYIVSYSLDCLFMNNVDTISHDWSLPWNSQTCRFGVKSLPVWIYSIVEQITIFPVWRIKPPSLYLRCSDNSCFHNQWQVLNCWCLRMAYKCDTIRWSL